MTHVASYKTEAVKSLVREFEGAQVIGIVNIHGIPAPQFQTMRKGLVGRVKLTVSKNSILRIALKEAAAKKAGLDALAQVIEGQTAVVTADINPFRLFKQMEATKTKAPARGGELAPEDLWVREGETPFKPGPIVGELQKAGVPAAIERGKVIVKKDKLLVKAGERIPREVAQVLTRLEIFPLTVGLDLRGAYEAGTVFRRDVLAVDDAKVRADLSLAGSQGLNLAIFIGYPSKDTIRPLLSTAYRRAIALAVESGFPTRESVKFLLAKAQAQALAIAARAPAAVGEGRGSSVDR
ncbi:MAG: 50S ribosomal protein L10 [Euryarchaeota archaeon RBG_16_68_12]|nr:MAG: 50S ribosomal protein L10 [Euryarchaeota archaeon RBG_16_68_12]